MPWADVDPGPLPMLKSEVVPARRCGPCTMCCRLTEVPELQKPLNKWCAHCIPGTGCGIYDVRPMSCQTFQCMWYKDTYLSDGLRPDVCRVMFEEIPDKVVLALIPPHYSSAWRENLVAQFITRLVRDGYVVAVSVDGGRERQLILPKGVSVEEATDKINRYAQQVGVLKDGSTELHDRPNDDQPSG